MRHSEIRNSTGNREMKNPNEAQSIEIAKIVFWAAVYLIHVAKGDTPISIKLLADAALRDLESKIG